ncbi:MAG: precorrin-2 C(20)-methyltransferase [Chloroflexota bacterium]
MIQAIVPSRPCLTGVGVGPGDPELLTLKAARAIDEADVIFAPTRRAGGRSMALDIVRDRLDERRKRIVLLPFPEGGHEGWRAVAERIVAELGDDRHGVFLTEGDPLLFGSFGHVMSALRMLAPSLTVHVVPGVSSITASAAAAGIPLTDYEDRLAVVPATADLAEVERALGEYECVVVLKVGSVLRDLLALLGRLDLMRQAVYVRRCGWPEQEIVHDVRTLLSEPPTDYFALLIVRPDRASRR